MEPLDTRQCFYSLSITIFALDHRDFWQYTAGRMDRPVQAVAVCFEVGGSGNMTVFCLFSRCSMSTEDGAKLYDVCPHVSDSVSSWFS